MNFSSLLRKTSLLAALAGTASAAPLMIRTSGVFSSADTATGLAAPGGAYSLGFTVDSNPQVSNVGSDGFDVAFSNFQYKLNDITENVTPDSIRFFNAANDGLFTAYFGPESGVDANGNFIPEFAFYGTSIYSGLETNPSMMPGTYTVRETVYSDNINYDDQFNPANVIAVTSVATPEPTAGRLVFMTLLLAALISFARPCLLRREGIVHLSRSKRPQMTKTRVRSADRQSSPVRR